MQTNSSTPSSQAMALLRERRTLSPEGEAAIRRRLGLAPDSPVIFVGAFMNLTTADLDYDNVHITSSSYNTSAGAKSLALLNQTFNDVTLSSSGDVDGSTSLNINSYSYNQSKLPPAVDEETNAQLVDKSFGGMQLGGTVKAGLTGIDHQSHNGNASEGSEGMRAKLAAILDSFSSREALQLCFAVALSISIAFLFFNKEA